MAKSIKLSYRIFLRIRINIFLILIAFNVSCVYEDILTLHKGDVLEGEKTTLLISLKGQDMIDVNTRASLTGDEERSINSMAIYIFDSEGKIVSSTFHVNTQAHVCDVNGLPLGVPLDPDGANYFPVETLTGNDRKIYVIANYDANLIENIKAISTEEQFKELIFHVVANPIFREFGVAKVGYISSAIRHGEAVQIPLRFVSAKITLNVINQYDKFKVEGWSVDNIPTKGYVWERTPDFVNDPNYHDATNVYDQEDYYHDFADQQFPFEIVPASVKGLYSSVFYITENRRGGPVIRDNPPVGWPYGSMADGNRDDYQLKAWFAPPGATYVKIYGVLTDDLGNKQLVTIKHYLGANNTNDYNVYRATNYTYNITISTFGKIKIDTNVELKSTRLRVDPPVDAMALDAHPGFRMFRVYTHEITEQGYNVRAEVLQAANSDVPAPWLNLSVIPVAMHHIKSNDPNIALWQQDGGAVGSYVRPKFIPNKETRKALSLEGKPYQPPVGVTIPSPQYPDDDTSLPFDSAIHRMCKKITKLPTKANNPELSESFNIIVYADEYPFDNSLTAPAYREAVIRFTIARDGVDIEYVYFTIRQYPPIRFVQLPGQSSVLLVERVEEYEHMLMPKLPINFQMLAGLQWGPYDLTSNSEANNINDGDKNTLYGVYSNISDRSADYYLPKYGSEAGGWSYNNNAKIIEPANATNGAPYFSLPAMTDPNHVNIIYNTTAARYCHEKNWDRNGNGKIDDDEDNWYLPSTVELQQFWTLHELLDMRPDYYWSSVQFDKDNAYALSMLSSPSDPHRKYNGVPQKFAKTGTHFINRPRVRCLRRKSGVTPLAPLVLHRSDNTSVVDASVLPGSVVTTQTKMGISQGDPSALLRANDKIFKKLEVNRKQYQEVDYYTLHFGNGLCDQSKGWRLPTQREMLLIWVVKGQLEAQTGTPAFEKFVNEDYWTMNRDLDSRYLVDFATGLAKHEAFQGLSIKHRYRCVREIP